MNKRRVDPSIAVSDEQVVKDEEDQLPVQVKERTLEYNSNLFLPISLFKGERFMVDQDRHPFAQAIGQTSAFFTDLVAVPENRDETRRQRILQYQNAKALRLLEVSPDFLATVVPIPTSRTSFSATSLLANPLHSQPDIFAPPACYTFSAEDEPWRTALHPAHVSYLTQQAIFHGFDGWALSVGNKGNSDSKRTNLLFPPYVYNMIWVLKPMGLLKLVDDDKRRGISQSKLSDMFAVLSIKKQEKSVKREDTTFKPAGAEPAEQKAQSKRTRRTNAEREEIPGQPAGDSLSEGTTGSDFSLRQPARAYGT
eukprot:gb/GEZN01010402.1/.p1 GENE.gb/GEZN01010402.1/~~gb/GEZN01010402.1/.p1  ORF type:complete len:310 (-),score=56.12 gb/GEZN01010402.1/:135-1064(-)